MNTRTVAARGAVAFLLGLMLAAPTVAQTFRGSILGTVTDSSGAVVSGATVTSDGYKESLQAALDAAHLS